MVGQPRPLGPPPEPGPATPVKIRPEDYYRVAKDFVDGQNRVQQAYTALLGQLRGLAGAGGNDDPAQKFGQTYTPAVRQVLHGFVRLHQLLGSIAQGLAESGENHRRADEDSTPGQPPGAPFSLFPMTCPAAVEPPPIIGEGDTGTLATLADFVTPYYPNADKDKLYQVSTAFDHARDEITAIGEDLHAKLMSLAGNNISEDLNALEEFWKRVAGSRDGTLFSELPKACNAISKGCSDYGWQVGNAREKIHEILGELAAELAAIGVVAGIAALFTEGVGGAAIARAGGGPALEAATSRMAVVAGELGLALSGAGAIAATAEAAGALTVAINNTPDPNVSRTESTNVGDGVGETGPTGGERLQDLPPETRQMVDDTIQRAKDGKTIYQKHDGKEFLNYDRSSGTHPLPQKPPGYYREWTASRPGMRRGPHRIILGGDSANPEIIYYWDHAGRYVRIYP